MNSGTDRRREKQTLGTGLLKRAGGDAAELWFFDEFFHVFCGFLKYCIPIRRDLQYRILNFCIFDIGGSKIWPISAIFTKNTAMYDFPPFSIDNEGYKIIRAEQNQTIGNLATKRPCMWDYFG